MTDAEKPDLNADKYVIERLGEKKTPMFLAINKIDRVPKPALLQMITDWSAIAEFDEIFPISARTGENVDELVNGILGALEEGPQFYPGTMITDQPETFFFAEIIREKAFLLLREELPYATAVIVDVVEDKPEGVTVIYATMYVERDSQKGIVIGKNGAMLKQIGSSARKELEKRLGTKIYLDIKVKVKEKWTGDERSMSYLGYKKEG